MGSSINITTWDTLNQRLSCHAPRDEISRYDDIIIPITPTSDGFVACDVYRSTPTGYNLTLAFDNGNDSGYAAFYGYVANMCLSMYTQSDFGNAEIIEEITGWPVFISGMKLRFMFGKIDSSLFVFVNNDCIYHGHHSGIDNFNNIRIRIDSPDQLAISNNLWIDNLVFYNDPIVIADFIDTYGQIKQTQTFDGSSIIVSGACHTLDGLPQAEFQPISVESNPDYSFDYRPGSSHRSPFNYLADYLNADTMTSWHPGLPLDSGAYLYSYYTDTLDTPDCNDSSGKFIPYTLTEYDTDPLRRVAKDVPPGVFSHYPVLYAYGHADDFIGGFNPEYYHSASVKRKTRTDENGINYVELYNTDDRLLASVIDSTDTGLCLETNFYPDYNGNDTLVIQPNGNYYHYAYNNQGWNYLSANTDCGDTKYWHDINGNIRFIETTTDRQNWRFRYFKYDIHNRIIEEGTCFDFWDLTQEKACDPEYPAESDTNFVVLATYKYDDGDYGRGRLVKSTRNPSGCPDSASWETYQYDEYGRVCEKSQFVHMVDDSLPRTMQAEYNLQNDLVALRYNNGKLISYAFDHAGRIQNVIDDDSTLMISYSHWPNGQVKNKVYGLAGNFGPAQHVDYRYNCRGWLLDINGGEADTSTDGSGDHFGLKLTYTDSSLLGLDQGYYNGNIASYAAKTSPNVGTTNMIQRFAFDAADRLREYTTQTDWNSPFDYQIITYDPNGNFDLITTCGTDMSITRNQYSYHNNSNRVKQITNLVDSTISWTPSGGIAELPHLGISMDYNYRDELAARVHPTSDGDDMVNYWYNADGMRIAKRYQNYFKYQCGGGHDIDDPVLPCNIGNLIAAAYGDVPGGVTYCLDSTEVRTGYYYFNNLMLSTYRGALEGNLLANFVYVNGERVAQFTDSPGDVRYYLNDHLGSVAAMVRYDGRLTNRTQYLPWGEAHLRIVADPYTSNMYGYTAQELEEELDDEWYYFGARYYDPELRIFNQVDPQYDSYPSLSSYLYCANNPMTYIDKDGEFIWLVLGALAGAGAYILSTPSVAQTPTTPEDIHTPTFGEQVLSQAFGVLNMIGASSAVNAIGCKAATANLADATIAETADVSKNVLIGPRGGKSWTTIRRNYWKREAESNPNRFSSENLKRTKKGLAEQRESYKTGKTESKHLHHKTKVSEGGTNEIKNLQEL